MAEKKKNKLFNSLEEIKKELFERSVWPTRQEVLNQTFLGAADYIVTFLTRALLDGSILSSIVSSKIALVLILLVVVLFVVYFAIRYIRKNRYSR